MEGDVDTELAFNFKDDDGNIVVLPVSYISFYDLDASETLFVKGFGNYSIILSE